MYKYNPFIMQNIRANTLIIGANNNPINKKVRLNADFSFNYYYLRNGKLYRNEHNMIRQALGEEIEYQD